MAFDGAWKRVVKDSKGPQDLDLTLQTQSEGIAGSISGQGMEAAIEGGRSAADNATWKVKLPKAMAVTLDFNVTLKADELAGKVKLGMFGSGELKGTRA